MPLKINKAQTRRGNFQILNYSLIISKLRSPRYGSGVRNLEVTDSNLDCRLSS